MAGIEQFRSSFLECREQDEVLVAEITQPQLTDEDNIEQFGRDLSLLVDHFSRLEIVLDLHRVQYLTSSVLGKLIVLHRRLNRLDGRLILCDVQDEVRSVLQTSRLLDYFEIAPDPVAALHRMQ